MAGKKNNATSSWSGYNHQGQVGIFLALNELSILLQNGDTYSNYFVEFEKENAEDIDIVENKRVVSRHQVKAKSTASNLNDYKDVLKNFNINNVNEDSRYLHTICEVNGFDLPEEEFNKLPNKPKYIPNDCKIRLYKYPDDKQYCELGNINGSKIDDFSKRKIKDILSHGNHTLKDDEEHINEILFELKDLLCKRIREAHKSGGGEHPIISFPEIYGIITSTKKREKQAIHRAKKLFEIYWNKNNPDNLNGDLFAEILNLGPDEFESFIIDLHPQKNIKSLKEEHLIDSLLDEDIFEEIFYEFYKAIDQKSFDISELCYNSRSSRYRLSLINKNYKRGEVGRIIQTIRNNREFLKASFDVDYLVNGRINSPILELCQQNERVRSPYKQQPSVKDNLFSNHLTFIDIEKTVENLSREQYE